MAHGSGGDVIEDLLRYTVWPQVMIADLAQVSTDTVSRILANSDIPRPRPAYHIRSVRAPQDLALTRRLWHHFLTERTQNGPLSALSIYRCAFKAAPAGLRVKSSTTKERLSRLKAGKSTRDLDRGTTLNEGTVLKMLPLMLIYNAMYGQLLPSPDLAGKEPNFNWVPEEHRDAFKAAVGMEVAQ